ncbi:MAG: dicarboxylate/amino acid:cation symporter [Bdellovibrionales bacterium]|nr:dicarboxylate/amino acid:cation symporter [Bdellovibrionales bacterium]
MNPISNLIDQTQALVKRQLWAKILLFLFLGLVVGYGLGPDTEWVSRKLAMTTGEWLALPGQVFLILMQMIVLPLVLTSVILGIVNAKSTEVLKKISFRLFPYFVCTTAVAILIGFFAAELLQPGEGIQRPPLKNEVSLNVSSSDKLTSDKTIPKQLTSVLPNNPLGSMLEGNLFQIVIFAIMIGVALLSLPQDQAEPVVVLLQSIQKTTMIIVGWAMYLAPIAVFGLMAELLSNVGFQVLKGIGAYALTVIVALLGVMTFYSLIVLIGAQYNPLKFFKISRSVQLLAFSTSSSAAVMPLTMETAEEKLHISTDISRFVIPLGTTINMDGTAAYQGVATCFIAQAYGLDLSLGQLGLIVLSATGASIGAPGTPGVGIAILSTLLRGIGIPSEGILLILGIDRILDMLRTVVNVTGDLTASLFFQKWMNR